MTPDNPVADRLLTDARKKAARQENPTLAKVALIVGVVGAIAAIFVPLAGWILGAVTIGLGVPGAQHPATKKLSTTAIVIGAAAILIGVFFFCLQIKGVSLFG